MNDFMPRAVQPLLEEHLQVMPVVVVTGAAWQDVVAGQTPFPEDWRAAARRGAFPDPAVHIDTDAKRSIWFDGYIQTYLERDLATLSSVASLVDFRRLVRAA